MILVNFNYMPSVSGTFPLTVLRSNPQSKLFNGSQREAGYDLINDTAPVLHPPSAFGIENTVALTTARSLVNY